MNNVSKEIIFSMTNYEILLVSLTFQALLEFPDIPE